MTLDACPHCGEPLEPGVSTCPHCGSDETTGWLADDEIDYHSLDLPEPLPDEEEHGAPLRVRGPGARTAVVAAILAVVLLASSVGYGRFGWRGLLVAVLLVVLLLPLARRHPER